ncbi:hypothetical protein AWENTII_006506 [Aspergillus wentii]|nr:hypothetical protein MW887_003286 [Aspergillus wentii]
MQDGNDGTPASPPSFSSCPPIFVLSTHLSLEELHAVEDSLVKRGACLTYDVSEARLVLGRIGQKKRAALELRSRGVWTEEAALPSSPEPPSKRRRIGHSQEERSAAGPEGGGLSTETESEEDGAKSQHDLSKHLRKPKSLPFHDQSVDIKVVKLEWLDRSIETEELLPIDPFIVYQARKIEPPKTNPADGSRVIQRAKEDAVFKPPAIPPSGRRVKEPHDGTASQHKPPKLYRQTTSEHDEAVPLPPEPDWVKDHVLYACMRSAPLNPPNKDFIAQLVKIRTIRELTLDEIGVRAYSTSIAAIAAYPYKFQRGSEVLSLPGCDAKIANLFSEFKNSTHGTIPAAQSLDTDPDLRILNELYRIWGVGAKTARDFYYARHWRDLDDVIEHGWDSLSRVQQIGVKYYDEFLEGIPRAQVEEIAQTVRRHANLVRPNASYDGRGVECVIVGGYRRGKESSGDVDLVLSHRDESITKNLVVDIVSSLETEGWVTHTLALNLSTSMRDQQTLPFTGDDAGKHFDSLDKALVVWQDPNFDDDHDNKPSHASEDHDEKHRQRRKRNPNPHRRVDIIISPWRTVGCAVLGWSGDKTFERDLRRYAKKAHGWKFDSSGVRERTSGGQALDLERGGETWEEREKLVMEAIGVGWRPAEERCTL